MIRKDLNKALCFARSLEGSVEGGEEEKED
jgi:hypothetical protein